MAGHGSAQRISAQGPKGVTFVADLLAGQRQRTGKFGRAQCYPQPEGACSIQGN